MSRKFASVKKYFYEKGGLVKDHLRKNKKMYLVGIGGLIAGFLLAKLFSRGGTKQTVDSFKFFWKSTNVSNNIVINEAVSKRLSYLTEWNENGEVFNTQSAAANAANITADAASKQIRGLIPHANGNTFTRRGVAI